MADEKKGESIPVTEDTAAKVATNLNDLNDTLKKDAVARIAAERTRLASAPARDERPQREVPKVETTEREKKEKEKKAEKAASAAIKGAIMTAITVKALEGEKGAFSLRDLLTAVVSPKAFGQKLAASTGDVIAKGFESARVKVNEFDVELVKLNRRYGYFAKTATERGGLGKSLLAPIEGLKPAGASLNFTLAELGITAIEVTSATSDLGDASSTLRNTFDGVNGSLNKSTRGFAQLAAVFKKAGVETKNFGTLVENVSKTFGVLYKKGADGAASATKNLQTQLLGVAKVLKQDVNVVTQEFNESLENLSFIGMEDALQQFIKLKTQSESTGISFKRLQDTVGQFNTFKEAGQFIGQMNALLGGGFLDPKKWMRAIGDPAERLEIIKKGFGDAMAAGRFAVEQDKAAREYQLRNYMATTKLTKLELLKIWSAYDQTGKAALDLKKEQEKLKKKLDDETAAATKDPDARFRKLTAAMRQNIDVQQKIALIEERNMQQLAKSGTRLSRILHSSLKGIDQVASGYLSFMKQAGKQMDAFIKLKNVTSAKGLIGLLLFGKGGESMKLLNDFIKGRKGMSKALDTIINRVTKQTKKGSELYKNLEGMKDELKALGEAAAEAIGKVKEAEGTIKRKGGGEREEEEEEVEEKEVPQRKVPPAERPEEVTLILEVDNQKMGAYVLNIVTKELRKV